MSFYELNKNQSFSFPHDSADCWTDDELWEHFMKPDSFAAFCISKLSDKTTLTQLSKSDAVRIMAIAWLRCKFLCEVLEPHKILGKRNPKWKLPEPLSQIQTMSEEEITNRWLKVECATNRIGLWLHDLYTHGNPMEADTTKLQEFNKQIHTIRERPCGPYEWRNINPHSLLPVPWATFLLRLYESLVLLE